MGAILRGQPPALRSVAPEVDEALAALCVRAMARDPAERFQTAAALEEALEHWLGSTGGQLGARPIAQWMVALFGSESAAAKLDVAAGSRVSAVLPLVLAAPARLSPLRAPERVTPEPSLEVSVSEAVSMTALRRQAAPARPGRHGRSWWLALGAGAVLATLAWLWALRVAPASAPDAAGPTGTLVVASSPTGAAVFVDGAPIGRVTPTRLSRLVPGRAITILVQLAGYEPSERQVAPVEGEHVEQFSLSPSGGRR